MIRTTIIDLNPVELNYYSFMISLDKCNGSGNIVEVVMLLMTYLWKYVLQVKRNVKVKVNVKVFNLVTSINKVKTLVKHTSCDCKCKFD